MNHLMIPQLDAARFAKEAFGFHPDPVQTQVLQVGHTRGILNCARQWGKSTTMAIKAFHRAYFIAKSQVLVVSPTERQSGELVAKAQDFACQLGLRLKGDGRNRISIKFPNGSRIIGLPGRYEGNLRGYTASMLLVDEAAQVRDEIYNAVRPMLAATNGELWLMSTPNGKHGFFYDEWRNGTEPWLRILATADKCSRYAPAFLEAERRKGEARFRQEYLGEFTHMQGAMFDEAQIRSCFDDKLTPFIPRV
jgi:terminase large subunit-like protein